MIRIDPCQRPAGMTKGRMDCRDDEGEDGLAGMMRGKMDCGDDEGKG